MAKRRISSVLPHASWTTFSRHIVLWHGTIRTAAHHIGANGIDPGRFRPATDFGSGFYTTTSRHQATAWAWSKYRKLAESERATDRPAVLEFRVPLDRLAALDALTFVRGDAGHDAFWAFVSRCRNRPADTASSHLHPGRPTPNDLYDVVCGPVAKAWPPRGKTSLSDCDQFAFHTAAALAILSSAIHRGAPHFQVHPL